MTDKIEVHLIPMRLIDAPEWNSRLNIKDDKELANLADSMDSVGLLAPITVEEGSLQISMAKDGGKPEASYTLIAGSRRFAAAKKLGWETIPAFVRPVSNRTERTIINIGENIHRKDLTSYELARACAELREQNKGEGKMTLAEIGKKVGLSTTRVQQLTVAMETLPGDIKTQWKKEGSAQDDNPHIMTTAFINELVALKDPDKQLKAFNEQKQLMEKLLSDGDGKPKSRKSDGKKSTAKNKRSLTIPIDRYKKACAAIKGQKAEKQIGQVLDYLIGESDEIPGLLMETKPTKKEGK